jgi:hypothetical protein
MAELIITLNDIRHAGRCGAGTKRWFQAHGLDFRDFVKNGIPASKLTATGDHYALDVVAKAEARANG